MTAEADAAFGELGTVAGEWVLGFVKANRASDRLAFYLQNIEMEKQIGDV